MDFAIDAGFPDAAADQLCNLAAKVDDKYTIGHMRVEAPRVRMPQSSVIQHYSLWSSSLTHQGERQELRGGGRGFDPMVR